jgi:hypothetical protein
MSAVVMTANDPRRKSRVVRSYFVSKLDLGEV